MIQKLFILLSFILLSFLYIFNNVIGINMKCKKCYKNSFHHHLENFNITKNLNHGPKDNFNKFQNKPCSICMKNPNHFHYHF